SFTSLKAQGNVYLVLGSDTGMWEGLSTTNYNCYIKGDLYTVPSRNGYQVMEDAFRNQLKDSYGGVMKLTWWMMSGNMFYLSINANTPVPNSMAPYLMKKYHGDKIAQFGDELTLHYHTFFWSDYDLDGKFFWNQAKTFNESRKDFDFTLAQNLIDENMFPVSFRSGWHFMDNDWQNYLNKLLPFSLHSDYPSRKLVDPEEPLDNVIDWSQAPATWVPYHPSPENYQLPGNSNGWNVRSKHIGSISQTELDSIFARASRGTDQVACLWGHLPEEDFLQNLKRVDSLVHKSAAKYPKALFRYCTAVEAMQRWLKTSDTTAPAVQVTEVAQNDKIAFDITTSEAIFQAQPFFAVKDVYERYTILNCQKTGVNSWRTEFTDRKILAKAGVAVTDPSGNHTTKLINFLSDDLFIDNEASSSVKINSGSWNRVSDQSCFDISYLNSAVDSAKGSSLSVTGSISQAGKYNVFAQFAKIDKPVDSLEVTIIKGGVAVDTVILKGGIKQRSWIYLSTITSSDNSPLELKISSGGLSQAGKNIAFDAIKISPLVRDKEIFIRTDFVDIGDIIVEKDTTCEVTINNRGTDPLQISNISVIGSHASAMVSLPVSISGMGTLSLPVSVKPTKLEGISDTLVIISNDPVHPVMKTVIKANSVNYFTSIDNEQPANYKETGSWSFSSAKGFGGTSRWAGLGQKPAAKAVFTKILEKSGTYDVLYTVPVTVNASNHALYILSEGTKVKDSLYINQNTGSGSWLKLTTRYLNAGSEITLSIIDAGGNTNPGAVLRSDAIRFNLVTQTGIEANNGSLVPADYALRQNYPNPFNPSTTISYSLPKTSQVSVKVYDLLGNEITTLVNGIQNAGEQSLRFSPISAGKSISSGVYFYTLKAVPVMGGDAYIRTLKMLYLK
ncbi:MAG: T9SS type A sorting domain-containing protein, partial [Ignavibacteriales bacterium]